MIIRSLDEVPAAPVEMDGVERPLAAGDFAFVAPEELHQFRNAGDEPFRFICAVPKEYE